MKNTLTQSTITEVLNKIADHKARQSETREGKHELSEAEKDRLIALEPTEAQVTLLKKFDFPGDEILSMDRLHAAEAISRKIAEREEYLARPITEKMVEGLLKWTMISQNFTSEALSQLTIGEGKRIYASLPRRAA